MGGFDLLESWLVATYVLYAIAAGCWIPAVAPQYRVRSLAEAADANGTATPTAYRFSMRLWFALGWPAFGALPVVYVPMVSKPALS